MPSYHHSKYEIILLSIDFGLDETIIWCCSWILMYGKGCEEKPMYKIFKRWTAQPLTSKMSNYLGGQGLHLQGLDAQSHFSITFLRMAYVRALIHSVLPSREQPLPAQNSLPSVLFSFSVARGGPFHLQLAWIYLDICRKTHNVEMRRETLCPSGRRREPSAVLLPQGDCTRGNERGLHAAPRAATRHRERVSTGWRFEGISRWSAPPRGRPCSLLTYQTKIVLCRIPALSILSELSNSLLFPVMWTCAGPFVSAPLLVPLQWDRSTGSLGFFISCFTLGKGEIDQF